MYSLDRAITAASRDLPYCISSTLPLLCCLSLLAPLNTAMADESLDEVVITASRRETKLFETPISMTVIGEQALRAVNADSFSDFASLVPGLTSIDVGPGQKRYALRGLQSAGEPEVALYYDEIPISGLPGASLDTGDTQPDIKLWDIDRVEVLRGPQGTLYGNGSMGGAIRILSKRPVLDQWQGVVETSAAATDGGSASWRLNTMINAPVIADKLAVRVVGWYRDEGGWLDNHYLPQVDLPQVAGHNRNTEKTWGGRASAKLDATDNWSITGIAYYQNTKTGDSFETYPSFATAQSRYVTQAFVRTPWLDESWMFNLISTTNLGWADFVVSGAHQERRATINVDSTRFLLSMSGCNEFTWNKTCVGPANVPADSSARQGVNATSAEMRLVSQSSGALQWTLGGFFQDSKTFRRGQLAITDVAGYINYDPTNGDAINRLFARSNNDVFDQRALFGEASYRFAKSWIATVGLRWFHSYRSDQQTVVQQFFAGAPTGEQPFQDFRESDTFKKFQLTREISKDALVYIEAAQGFRAGGPNYPGGFTATAPPYAADSIWNYELGWKAASTNHRVEWTGALFRIDWSNVQQLLPTQIFSAIVNGGKARSDGFETELTARVTRVFTLNAGVSYSNAHLVGPQPIVTNPSSQLYAGDTLGGVPKWTGNAAASYERAMAHDLILRSRLDYSYLSSRSSVVATQSPAYFRIGDAKLTNFSVALERNVWTASFHINNLLNDFVPLSGKSQDGNQIHTITAARPRTVSLNLQWRSL